MESANDAATAANETLVPGASAGQVADTGTAGADAGVGSNAGLAGAPAKPDLDAELRAVWDKNHSQRAPNGRFVARDGGTGDGPPGGDAYIRYEADGGLHPNPPLSREQALPPQAGESSQRRGEGTERAGEEPVGDAAKRPVEQEEPAIDPPISWSAEMKGRWSHLPPDVQTYVAQRDKETHAAITRAGQYLKALDQQIKGYQPLDQLIEAHQDMFARRGVTPAQGFAVLLEAQRKLDIDPVAGLTEIGLMYGIDLRRALQALGLPAGRAMTDPNVSRLEARMRSLEDQAHAQQSQAKGREQAALEAEHAVLQRTVGDFVHDKPYFEQVRPLVSTLLRGGQASDLAEAYDMAVNAHPNIRQRIHADQRKAEEEKRTAEARAKADQARRAAAVNVRSAPVTATPKTMDDTLNEIARRRYA